MKGIIGSRLRLLRQRRGWTTEDVSGYTQIPQGTLEDWELGKSVPPADRLAKLAKLYGVSLDFLVTGRQTAEHLKRRWPKAFSILSAANYMLTGEEKAAFEALMLWLLHNRGKIVALAKANPETILEAQSELTEQKEVFEQ